MARSLTPEQQAFIDSKPVGYQYTPEEARFLGYTQDAAGRWRLNGEVESFGGNLPRKGRSTAAAVAIGAAAPLGALAGAQFLPALAGGAAPAAAGTSALPAATAPMLGAPAAAAGAAPAAATVGGAAASTVPFWAKAGIGLGADLAKTLLSNRTSGQANEALQQGGREAMATYDRLLGPYAQFGQQNLGALGTLMGLGGGAVPGGPVHMAPGGTARAAEAPPTPGRLMPPGATPSPGFAVPRGATPTIRGLAQPMADAQQASSFGGGGMVRMVLRGVEDLVPVAKVPQARAMGALEVR